MKILFATSSFGGGGITSYAHEVIDCYKSHHEIVVMVGDDSKNPILDETIKVFRIECNDLSYLNAQKALRLIVDEINPDCIINSNAKLITLLTPYLPNNIKVLSVSHSLKYIEADTAGVNSSFIDGIVALSEHAKEYLDLAFHIEDKNFVKVVPNFMRGIDNADVVLKEKINNKTQIIVFAGGGSPVKSPDLVAKILKKLLETDLNFKFYWIGASTPPLHKLSLFHDLSELFKKDPRLVFTGRLTREKCQKIIASANIYLFPSRREGCPMSLLEAMRVGTIPIVADYPHANIEIINNGMNGYVIKKDDISGFVERIRNIIENPENYSNIYHNSYMTYKTGFTYGIWKERMNDLIINLPMNHKQRLKTINKNNYCYSRARLYFLRKKSSLLINIHEAIPSYINIMWMYINK